MQLGFASAAHDPRELSRTAWTQRRVRLAWKKRRARALCAVALMLSACSRAPKKTAEPSASTSALPGSPALNIKDPSYDFGSVVQGEIVEHTFELANTGSAPLELEARHEALGCVGLVAPSTLGPGARARFAVRCQTEFFGPLRVTLPISRLASTDFAGQVELAASVTPRLTFDTPLVELEMPFGEARSAEVRLVGALAGRAQLKLKDAGGVGFEVRLLGAPPGPTAGLALRVKPKKVGVSVGNLVFLTNLPQPSELTLPYSCKVFGTLNVSPTTPYFDLSAKGPKVQTVTVKSSQPGFVVRGVRVLEGPFSASFADSDERNQFRVTVTVREDKMWDEARSALGRLLILSNDRTEPRKELPLFGFGALNRAPASSGMAPRK